MKSFYNKGYAGLTCNDDAIDLSEKIRDVLETIVKEYYDQGYQLQEILSICNETVVSIISGIILKNNKISLITKLK